MRKACDDIRLRNTRFAKQWTTQIAPSKSYESYVLVYKSISCIVRLLNFFAWILTPSENKLPVYSGISVAENGLFLTYSKTKNLCIVQPHYFLRKENDHKISHYTRVTEAERSNG